MKVGLLPLYISLYDKGAPQLRERLYKFYDCISGKIAEKGIEVITNDFCCEPNQFEEAIAKFEKEECDAVMTLHMAYSPSLKSIEALAKTSLPVIVVDTTDTEDFSDSSSPSNILYCHGIHGVMDMCNMLNKNNKPYAIAAGYYETSDVIERAVGFLKAAVSAKAVLNSKTGSIGGYFDGMGDFQISDEKLKEKFGIDVIYPKKNEFEELAETVTKEEIEQEKQKNSKEFDFIEDIDDKIYTNSVKADLTLKKWIEKNELNAVTVNFRNICGLPTMPFVGACRAMQSGVGYAGEGDKFTASFVGGLLQGYKNTSFVEIFCPDWKNNSVMISHMGEMNYNVVQDKPEAYEKNFVFGDCDNPIVATAAYKEGNAVFINIFENCEGINALIAPVRVLGEKTDNFKKNIRGWLDFGMPIGKMLAKISIAGATHHSILVYDTTPGEMKFFAKLTGVKIY
ncbi:MAG: hypothetical protein IJQ50_04310, partial [Clostridia bacterium]|nr:hypothetical protein [Clostridia bacterium]